MFLVVSRWQAKPGMEEEFRRVGQSMRSELRAQPGVELVEGFLSGDTVVAVHGYSDEAAYQRIVQDPNGPFAAAAAKHGIEDVATWIGSDSGSTEP